MIVSGGPVAKRTYENRSAMIPNMMDGRQNFRVDKGITILSTKCTESGTATDKGRPDSLELKRLQSYRFRIAGHSNRG